MKIPAADGTDEWDMGGQWVSRCVFFLTFHTLRTAARELNVKAIIAKTCF